MLTIREIGDELKVDKNHVYRLIQRGLLAAVNISPGSNRPTLRVTRNALVKFVETEGGTKKPSKKIDLTPVPQFSGIRKLRKRNSIRAGESPTTSQNPSSVLLYSDNNNRHG